MRRIARRVRPVFRSRRRKNPSCSAAGQPLAGSPSGNGKPRAPWRARDERLHDVLVFLREHRARDIQQFTTRREQLPKRVQDRRLPRRESRRDRCARRSHLMSGWRRTTPEAEHGTSARMRSKGAPSHQVCERACNRAARTSAREPRRSRLRAMRSQRAASTSSAVSATSARSRICAALAARRGARIEHALPGARSRQTRGALRACILHRDFALGKARQALDRHRLLEQQRLASAARRARCLLRRAALRYSAANTPRDSPAGHRRMRVAGGENLLPARDTRRARKSIHHWGC